MANEADDNPLDQLLDLFVYAPVGMLYEYPEVLPKLIKRGKSQVQLAKFVGQMALKQQQGSRELPSISPELAADVVGRLITEIGSVIGLAPPKDSPLWGPTSGTDTEADSSPDAAADEPDRGSAGQGRRDADGGPKTTERLPIAKYDELTAKDVIFLLDDLTAGQLERVRRHEQSNRNRKTVLAKIDRLLG